MRAGDTDSPPPPPFTAPPPPHLETLHALLAILEERLNVLLGLRS